jgi:hypothetical protein
MKVLLAIVAAIAGLALLRRIAALQSGGANASPQPDSSGGSNYAPSDSTNTPLWLQELATPQAWAENYQAPADIPVPIKGPRNTNG